MLSPPTPRGIYLLTPDTLDTATLIAQVQPLLPHITWLQYRNKLASPALGLEQALALQPLCQSAGVPLIINDDLALAHHIQADGIHLGQDDGAIATARQLLSANAIVGASCYNELALAEQAIAAGASYVAFGAFFPSPTKPNARQASLNLLQASQHLTVPKVAIGGLTPNNSRAVVTAGADLLAVISGVFQAPNPLTALHAYLDCFKRI